MRTCIQNAQVVLPTGIESVTVAFAEGKIVEVGDVESKPGDVLVDASGMYLIPGVVDDQVHFREPGLTHKEDWAHATRACAKGGVTSFLEMPNTIPNTVTQAVLEDKLDQAAERCRVNYGFYIGATLDNLDELVGAHRTPGIKIFIGSSTGNMLVDSQPVLEEIFANTTLPICAHCEDEATVQANLQRYTNSHDVAAHSKVRDHQAALIATRRAIDLAHRHDHHFHVLHVSTAAEIDVIAAAGDLITSEVCPHHLFFNIDDYERLGSLVKMNPSIKTAADNEALWQGLLSGKIDIVATDHAPHTLEEKRLPYPDCPSGLPAVENSLALMLNQVAAGRCTLEQVVEWMCRRPAEIWHMRHKGKIEVGYDADLVLVDLDRTQTVLNENQQTKCGWTPWHGQSLTGWPVRTWVQGQNVFWVEDGKDCFDDSVRGGEIEFDQPKA